MSFEVKEVSTPLTCCGGADEGPECEGWRPDAGDCGVRLHVVWEAVTDGGFLSLREGFI